MQVFANIANNLKALKMNTLQGIEVSLFAEIVDKQPQTAFLLDILTSDEYKKDVEKVRKETDHGSRQKLKQQLLPAFTVGGVCEGREVVKPSGFLCLDIDAKDNTGAPNFGELKQLVKTLPFVAYCGHSCGGEGYFCIIPIAKPERYKEHYRSLQALFARNGITVDKQCCDIGHLRYVSYDPEPYINDEAEPYRYAVLENHTSRNEGMRPTAEQEAAARGYMLCKLAELAKQQGVDLTADRGDWIAVGLALANELGEAGREAFHDFSCNYPNYSPEEVDNKYTELLRSNRGKVHAGTVLHLAREHGLGAHMDFAGLDIEP